VRLQSEASRSELLLRLFWMAYFVYCIRPTNESRNRTYIGYSTDPARSLREHNGEILGGPRRTASHRPWSFVVLVNGFPSSLAAQQFKFCWRLPYRQAYLAGQSQRLGTEHDLHILVGLILVVQESTQCVLSPFFQSIVWWDHFGTIPGASAIRHVLVSFDIDDDV